MAASAPTFDDIKKSIRAHRLAPVYLLHGEEGYYCDALAREFENVLPDDEKDFNQYVLYAPEVEPARIIDLCRRIPMMSERQVVIVKEAQAVNVTQLAKLAPYIADPVATTLLVICCRGVEIKNKDLTAAIKKGNGVAYCAKRVYESNIPTLASFYLKEHGLNADPKALEMLRENIGADLAKLYNELEKLAGLLPPNATVTPEVVEQNVGMSRQYNVFELVDALSERDAHKVFSILSYFRSNQKAVPLVMASINIFNYFADLLIAYYAPGQTDAEISAALNLSNSFRLKRIRIGMKNYKPFQIIEILGAIRAFDAMSKGVGSRQNEHQLFHDLAFHILSAPGKL